MNIPTRFRWLGAVAVLGLAPESLAQGYYYKDSPRASDADKIATQMLNDAASGRFRGMNFSRTPNPFDRMIEDYENAKRARWAQHEQYAENARQWQEEREARERYETRIREEDARRRAEARARELRVEVLRQRAGKLQEEANRFDAYAHLELGMSVEDGRFESGVLTFPAGVTPRQWALERYEHARRLGSDAAVIALGCAAENESPSFARIWASLETMSTVAERRAHLATLAERGHLGANLWLGGWYSGRLVRLGTPPKAGQGEDHRQLALRYLDRARKRNLAHAGPWYAEALLAGDPSAAERTEALALLNRLVAPGADRNLTAAPALIRELLRDARVEFDYVRPRALMAELGRGVDVPALAAIAAVYLEGGDGEFHPGLAAAVYARIPAGDRLASYQAVRYIGAGIDAWLGIDGKRDARAALAHFDRAVEITERIKGGVLPEHRFVKVDAAVWQAFLRSELGVTAPGAPDPRGLLAAQISGEHRLAHLLQACTELGDRRTPAHQARNIWGFLERRNLFTGSLSPVETWLALQCVVRAYERGVAPEAGPFLPEIRALAPKDVPTHGAALLARMYFTPLHARDVADREGIAGVYASLVRAAWREPKTWRQVAALVEAVQIESLSLSQWTSGWLAPLLVKHPGVGEEPAFWAALVMNPTPARRQSLEKRFERLAGPPTPELADVQAMHASLSLRAAPTNQDARSAFERLMALGQAQSWHAQAMLEDFSTRFQTSYARRQDPAGFRRDAREAAEAVAAWRTRGIGCMMANDDLRLQAIGTALAHGSTRYTRDVLVEAAKHKNRAAQVALLKLAALDEDKRTPQERRDDEAAELLWERYCARSNLDPSSGSVAERLDQIGTEMAKDSGVEAAVAFWWRQAGRTPSIGWKIAEGYAYGRRFFPRDPRAALAAFRRATNAGAPRPRFAELITWGDTAAAHGEPEDFAALDRWLQDPAFSVARWRDPKERRFLMKLNPPIETAERLAAGMVARGFAKPGTATAAELARARRFHLLAVGLGSTVALRRLAEPPFATMSGTPAAVARTLLETSTLNAPLALEPLRRAAAAGDSLAPLQLLRWREAKTGNPTPRLRRIQILRTELQSAPDQAHVDPVRYATNETKPDYGWLTLEQAMLVRAAKQGDTEARRILIDGKLISAGLIALTPDEWVQRTRASLNGGDRNALWSAATEAAELWRLARIYWIPGNPEWVKAARTIGELATTLAKAAPPPGRSLDALVPLYEIGLLGGHGPSFENLLRVKTAAIPAKDETERARKRDRAILDLAVLLLERDPGNAVFLEKVARPQVRDSGLWNALFRERLLHADESGSPTSVLEFARASAAKKVEAQKQEGDDGSTPGLHPVDERYRFGHTGYLLHVAAKEKKDPLAARALAALGFGAHEWEEILYP
jgi:hypothetical protein